MEEAGDGAEAQDLDAASGEQRALGQFSPQPMMGSPQMLQGGTDCDAVWVSAHYGSRRPSQSTVAPL